MSIPVCDGIDVFFRNTVEVNALSSLAGHNMPSAIPMALPQTAAAMTAAAASTALTQTAVTTAATAIPTATTTTPQMQRQMLL